MYTSKSTTVDVLLWYIKPPSAIRHNIYIYIYLSDIYRKNILLLSLLLWSLKFWSFFRTSSVLLCDKWKKKQPCDKHMWPAELCQRVTWLFQLPAQTGAWRVKRCSASSLVCWRQTLDFVSQAGITQFPQSPLIKSQIHRRRHKELPGRLTVHCRCCKCQSVEGFVMERAWERHLCRVLVPSFGQTGSVFVILS